MSSQKPWEPSWVVTETLGRGGQGETHLVENVQTKQKAVLKTLVRPDDPKARARMKIEVTALKTLHDDTGAVVPSVLDGNTDSGEKILYFVMEYIEGQTLQDFVAERHPLSMEMASDIVEQLLATTEEAHGIEISHRDVKPQNIMIRASEPIEVVMVDYGLAYNDRESDDLTDTTEAIGNSFLRLPETAAPGSGKRDPRSDIVGLVGILYFCLTNKTPGVLEDGNGLHPHQRPGSKLTDVGSPSLNFSGLDSLFDRGFQRNLSQRFQSAGEFRHRLRHVMEGKEEQAEPLRVALARGAQALMDHDRPTQINHFRKGANKVCGFITADLNVCIDPKSFPRDIPCRFQVLAWSGLETYLEFPEDFVPLTGCGVIAKIATRGDVPEQRLIYAIGARRSECVLMSMTLIAKNQSGSSFDVARAWEELGYWSGVEETPKHPNVQSHMNASLVRIIEDLNRRALQK